MKKIAHLLFIIQINFANVEEFSLTIVTTLREGFEFTAARPVIGPSKYYFCKGRNCTVRVCQKKMKHEPFLKEHFSGTPSI